MICVFVATDFVPEYVDGFDGEIDNWIKVTPDYLTSPIYHPKYNLEYYPDKLMIRSGRLLTLDGENDY